MYVTGLSRIPLLFQYTSAVVYEARGFFTGLINEMVPEEDKLTIFPRGGPFLATQKIGKNNPKEAEIINSNEIRQEWNAAVSDAMMRGMPVEDLKEMKMKLVVKPVAGSIKMHGKNPAQFIRILKKAIAVLIEKARDFRPSILASLERFKAVSDRMLTVQKALVNIEKHPHICYNTFDRISVR